MPTGDIKPKKRGWAEKGIALAMGAALKMDRMDPGVEDEGLYRHPADFPDARRTDLETQVHEIEPEGQYLPGSSEPQVPNEYRPRMR